MRAPVGSVRWQLGLLGWTLAGVALGLNPLWWLRAALWELDR